MSCLLELDRGHDSDWDDRPMLELGEHADVFVAMTSVMDHAEKYRTVSDDILGPDIDVVEDTYYVKFKYDKVLGAYHGWLTYIIRPA